MVLMRHPGPKPSPALPKHGVLPPQIRPAWIDLQQAEAVLATLGGEQLHPRP